MAFFAPKAAEGAKVQTLSQLAATNQAYPANTLFLVSDPGCEGWFWVDPLDTTSPVDGGLVRLTGAGQRVKRVLSDGTRYQLSWWKIVGDGTTYWQNQLETVLGYVNNCTLVFGNGTYRFAALPPGTDFNTGTPCGISLSDRQITLQGQGVKATTLLFDAGTVGISNVKSRAATICGLEKLTLQATGKIATDGKNNDGTWAEDLGTKYKFNGVNSWNQMRIVDVDIEGFSGSGCVVFGSLEVRYPGRPIHTQVYFYRQGSNQLRVYAAGAYTIQQMDQGTFVYQGQQRPVGGSDYNNGYLVIQDIDGVESSLTKAVEVDIIFPGYGLVADCGSISGVCEFRNNSGGGLYFAGSDANQWSVTGLLTVRGNGHWGVFDDSLLGNHFFAVHGTGNGGNFNQFGVGGISGNNILTHGSFKCVRQTSNASFVGCYTEGGNQGADQFGESILVLGGVRASGATGGFGMYEGRLHSIRATEYIQGDGSHFSVQMQNNELIAAAA